jgi:hypothetical protein
MASPWLLLPISISYEFSVCWSPGQFTVWVIAVEVLGATVLSPPYTAVMRCLPRLRAAVLKVAVPEVSDPVPRVVVPSLKVTVPVAEEGVTAAVKVTDWPSVDGFWEEVRTVLLTWRTVWTSVGDVLPESLASPPYTAVMLWLPTDRLGVMSTAFPAFRALVPRLVVPSKKVTVPVANDGVTVAVKVTASPTTEGLREEASVVLVLAWLTIWLRGGDVLPESLASPS